MKPWEKYKQTEGPWTKYQDKNQPEKETSLQEFSQLKGLPFRQKIWQGLTIPEQMSKSGLSKLSSMVPEGKVTGNLPMDIARGTPRIMADTFSKAAPPFLSRASLLTMAAAPMIGMAGKALAPVGEGIASGLEDWSGIKPSGSVKEAAKDASLIFSKGKSAAGKFYKAEPELGKAGLFSGMYKPEQIVDKAQEIISKGGKLEPSEGLMYRKAIDSLMKSGRYVKDELISMRNEANAIAKESENIKSGDIASRRGMMANALRSLTPKNIGGRSSPFKVGEGLALAHMGPLGKLAALAFSPAAIGVGATALGGAGRIASNPQSAVAALQLLRQLRERNANFDPQQ